MRGIPFSVYDFFGYLSAGVMTLAGASFAYRGVEAFSVDLNASQVVVAVIAAYLAGHVVAAVSGFLLERRLTRGLIGAPTYWLFRRDPITGWRRLLAAYHEPLPAATAHRVLSKAEAATGTDNPGEDLFYHCLGVVQGDEHVRDRLAVFLNLYGFARNASMAAFIGAALIGAATVLNDRVDRTVLWTGASVAVFVGGIMYLRYLKFYRHYSVTLFLSYAEVNK